MLADIVSFPIQCVKLQFFFHFVKLLTKFQMSVAQKATGKCHPGSKKFAEQKEVSLYFNNLYLLQRLWPP